MGKFYSASISTTDPTERATSISNWFDNLDGVSAETLDYEYDSNTYKSVNISIDNTSIELLFGIKSNNVGTSVVHANNGENVLISDIYKTGDNSATTDAKLYAYIDADCIMISVCQSNTYNPTTNGIELVYVKTSNDKHLIGYYVHNTRGVFFADIASLTFEDVSDNARLHHSYTNMFPFAAISGQVDFLNQAYFVNANPGSSGATKSFKVDILRECSTVSLLSTISLPDPLPNHVAFGAHCIAPLDNEEVSE